MKSSLVVVAGLVASGKSTLARAVAERLGAERLEADRIRGTLLEATVSEAAGAEARWRRDLSPDFEAAIYADLLRRAEEVLATGRSVVLDACFPRRAQREAARAVAARHAAPYLFVHCRVPDATLRARLSERDRAAGRPVWETIHQHLADHYEVPTELVDDQWIEVVSDGETDPLVDAVESGLAASRPRPALEAPLRPRAVSFDCWQTLITEEDWPWAHSLRVMALRDAAREAGRDIPLETAERAFDVAWRRHTSLWHEGKASGSPEIAAWGLAELGLDDAGPVHDHLVHRYQEASHTAHVAALDGARPLLAALNASGTPCVLVCDTGLTPGRVVRRLLDRVGLLEHLRVLAFSDEVGVPKPDPRPFRAAIDPLGVEPEDALHVGDLRRTDVAGARGLGMATVRIRARHDDTGEERDADHVVSSHAELAGLLGLGELAG